MDIIKNKEYFTMSNLKTQNDTPEELNFIISNDFSLKPEFYKKLSEILSDKIFDTNERNNFNYSDVEEKRFVDNLFKYDIYNNFPILKYDNSIEDISLNILYDEDQEIKGNTNEEIVSNIGQSDKINETVYDESRCGAALIINFLILNKGKEGFFDFSRQLNLDFDKLTYRNVHLLQEKIMDTLQSSQGLSIKSVDNDIIGGTLSQAFNISGIKWEKQFLKKVNGSYEPEIKNYLSVPKRALAISVYLDKNSSQTFFDKESNHIVLLTSKNGDYFLTDSSGKNALGKNHFKLDQKELKKIYNSLGAIVKIAI